MINNTESFEYNVETYRHLLGIEVGVRELLIHIIRKNGIDDWFNKFLNQIQRQTIKDVRLRIRDLEEKGERPSIEYLYIIKTERAKKDIAGSLNSETYDHPFYYLNWNDLEMMLKIKVNVPLIDKEIGAKNRELLVQSLYGLSGIRNDVAHSRLIGSSEAQFVKGTSNQIRGLIENFDSYLQQNSKELSLSVLLTRLSEEIKLVQTPGLLSITDIDKVLVCIDLCLESFWLRSLQVQLYQDIMMLKTKIAKYRVFRTIPGGLLDVQNWKVQNEELLSDVINKCEPWKNSK
jgi:hypothetical protein